MVSGQTGTQILTADCFWYLTDLPEGTTETLPVRFVMAGNTVNVTLAGGANATVANFPNPGVFLVFYDRIDNILQLIGQI